MADRLVAVATADRLVAAVIHPEVLLVVVIRLVAARLPAATADRPATHRLAAPRPDMGSHRQDTAAIHREVHQVLRRVVPRGRRRRRAKP